MKNPLHYQITEYDCGPVSLINGISFLFEREEIPPEVVRNIMLYSLDGFGTDGVSGKSGTSHTAMLFLSHWLEGFGKTGRLALQSAYLSGRQVHLGQNSPLRDALIRRGAAVVRLDLEGWHYVLLTGFQDGLVRLFDPYRVTEDPFPVPDVEVLRGCPELGNRLVSPEILEQEILRPYAMGPVESREAVLLFNRRTVLTPEETVEYMI